MQAVRYVDLVFHPDMLVARRDDGAQLRLTRQERALLLRLCRTPHKLVTRAQLLQSMGEFGSEFGERNIDYLVNRLRKRLGENARAPRFIATQYGEGYVWVADPVVIAPVSAFLLVGPVYGMAQAPELLTGVLQRLSAATAAALGGGHTVSSLPQWRFAAGSDERVTYSLEVSLLQEQGQVHMAAILRDGATHAPIGQPFRVTLPAHADAAALDTFAQALVQAIWSHAALPAMVTPKPRDQPLHLKLHDAGALFGGDMHGWRENAQRLAQAYAERPEDPGVTVMLAINRYEQLLMGGGPDGPLDDAQWLAVEDEMERLALQALPLVQGDAMQLFGIAKVLFFIDRGYLTLAERLTDTAFRSSTAFASACAMKAQLQAAGGEIDAALDLYDRAIELAEPGATFHIYLHIMKMTALMADNRRGAVAQVATALYAGDPGIRTQASLFFLSPRARHVPPALQPLLEAMTLDDARRMLMYLYRVSARQFQHHRHQRNVMHGAAVHLADRFGPDVLPPALALRYPGLGRRGR